MSSHLLPIIKGEVSCYTLVYIWYTDEQFQSLYPWIWQKYLTETYRLHTKEIFDSQSSAVCICLRNWQRCWSTETPEKTNSSKKKTVLWNSTDSLLSNNSCSNPYSTNRIFDCVTNVETERTERYYFTKNYFLRNTFQIVVRSTMVNVTRMLNAHMTRPPLLLSVLVRLDTQMLEPMERWNVKVCTIININHAYKYNSLPSSDSCNVNNGGCDPYATCSHCKTTFAVVCTCNKGYTNVGTGGIVKCEGRLQSNVILLT